MTEEFLEHLRIRGYAESTVQISRRWLEHFRSRCPQPLKKLREKDLTKYRQSLQWEPGPSGKLFSENTVNQAVGVVRAYFRWCVEQGYLEESPAEHLTTRRVPPREPLRLGPEQVRAVLALPDFKTSTGLRDRGILGLFLEFQASPAAVSGLNLADFQADTGALLLRGRGRRIVSVGVGLQADLERYLRLGRAGLAPEDEEAFFVTRDGRRMGPQNAARILKENCRRAGVPKPGLRP